MGQLRHFFRVAVHGLDKGVVPTPKPEAVSPILHVWDDIDQIGRTTRGQTRTHRLGLGGSFQSYVLRLSDSDVLDTPRRTDTISEMNSKTRLIGSSRTSELGRPLFPNPSLPVDPYIICEYRHISPNMHCPFRFVTNAYPKDRDLYL
jgi:hypothetical protein